jgi:hypothetical protein
MAKEEIIKSDKQNIRELREDSKRLRNFTSSLRRTIRRRYVRFLKVS